MPNANNAETPLKILMVTNTYLNIVGGLEKSVQSFSARFREMGHQVLIAGPDFVGQELGKPAAAKKRRRFFNRKAPEAQPALQNNDTQTLLAMPFAHRLTKVIDRFKPDIIHAHHPFLMGEMGLRFAARYDRPLVFTYHILFNQYSHYLGGSSSVANRFLVELAAGYANNVTRIIAPSESVRQILLEEGVHKTIDVVPTGVDVAVFSQGNRGAARQKLGVTEENILIGHIGRISIEKNIEFLTQAVIRLLRENENAHFMLAGKGPLSETIEKLFDDPQISKRVHITGALQGQDLVDHYHALDLFVFSSKSETQGMVLTEAMAAGVPVLGIDAPGVRETIQDKENGRLVKDEEFDEALSWCVNKAANKSEWEQMRQNARATAETFSVDKCAKSALRTYRAAADDYAQTREKMRFFQRFKVEIDILYNFSRAGILALGPPRGKKLV